MPISADILDRRTTRFVLWSPRPQATAPVLVLSNFRPGNPPGIINVRRVPLAPAPGVPDGLWELPAADCGLSVGTIYHYWIEVDDSRSAAVPPARVSVTDPFARSVDWRVFPPGRPRLHPAGVGGSLCGDWPPRGVRPEWRGRRLRRGGRAGRPAAQQPPGDLRAADRLDAERRLQPARARGRHLRRRRRARRRADRRRELRRAGGATARDGLPGGAGGERAGAAAPGRQPVQPRVGLRHLPLPCARLRAGVPRGEPLPDPQPRSDPAGRGASPQADPLLRRRGDGVRAGGSLQPHRRAQLPPARSARDAGRSRRADLGRAGGRRDFRDGFGSTSGGTAASSPPTIRSPGKRDRSAPRGADDARHLPAGRRLRVDGMRLDSVKNIANWDFVQDVRERGRALHAERWQAAGLAPNAGGGVDEPALPGRRRGAASAVGDCCGERLDGLWNETFKRGCGPGDPRRSRPTASELRADASAGDRLPHRSGSATARRRSTTSPRTTSAASATSGCTTSSSTTASAQIEKRIKLAFACLLTAVGIPMILAGEEFADQHDLFRAGGRRQPERGQAGRPGELLAPPRPGGQRSTATGPVLRGDAARSSATSRGSSGCAPARRRWPSTTPTSSGPTSGTASACWSGGAAARASAADHRAGELLRLCLGAGTDYRMPPGRRRRRGRSGSSSRRPATSFPPSSAARRSSPGRRRSPTLACLNVRCAGTQ